MKPFLKWPGGKRRLAERILNELPAAETYVEPFLGAGAVALLAMQQGKYQNFLLADADIDLIATWQAVKDDVSGVLAYQSVLLAERDAAKDQKAHYYTVRDDFNNQKGDYVATAARMLYLNAYTFNGLYRKNSKGGFNAPYGYRKTLSRIESPDFPQELSQISVLLNSCNVVFACNDFSEILVPEGAVGYFDPPYWPRQGNGFTAYTARGFSEQDQRELAEHFRKQRGLCIQTNGPGAAHLYEGLDVRSLNEPTVIAPTGEGRGAAETLLIVNRPCPRSS